MKLILNLNWPILYDLWNNFIMILILFYKPSNLCISLDYNFMQRLKTSEEI